MPPAEGMTPATAIAVKRALQEEKREQQSHEHPWDVADVMAALRRIGIETHEEINLMVGRLIEEGIIDIRQWDGAERRLE